MFGKYKTYEDKAIITAVVQRAKDSTEPVEVSVRYQACNADNCLIPYDAAMSDGMRHSKTCGMIAMISTTETIMISVPAGPEGRD